MSITWVLVANTRSAILYENPGPNKGLTLVKKIATEQNGSEKAQPIGAMDRSDWHRPDELQRQRAKVFARKLADELRLARTGKQFSRAILIAPAAFMGLLNAELDSPTAQQVSARMEKDYTKLTVNELREELAYSLCV